MNFTPYNYSIVLKDIYGLTSVDAITSIIVEPADMDNTEAGQALQKEIGKTIITTIYKTISSMVCLDDDNWDKIGIGDDINTLEEVRQGRYLTIKFDNGMQIDNLK